MNLPSTASHANLSGPDGPGSKTPYRSAVRPGLFEGQTIIVTGGGSGLGRCTAHELASLGANVALVGRQAAKLETVAAEIEGIYPDRIGHISTTVCDIRDEVQVKACVICKQENKRSEPLLLLFLNPLDSGGTCTKKIIYDQHFQAEKKLNVALSRPVLGPFAGARDAS